MEYTDDQVVPLDEDNLTDAQELKLHPLVAYVKDCFDSSKRSRLSHEQRMLRAFYNYRGLYGKEIQFTETEKSRAFVKITKTKVHAAFGQMCDIIFSSGKLPLTIEPTPVPEGIAKNVYISGNDPKGQQEQPSDEFVGVGYAGDDNPLKPGEGLFSRLGHYLSNKFSGTEIKVKEGVGHAPEDINFRPAEIAAAKMQKKIHDQLEEASAAVHTRNALFESTLLGTGCIKGPFTSTKEYPYWNEMGLYSPVIKDFPDIKHVSIWNVYPDPNATNHWDWEWVIERHKMSRTALRHLKQRPFFVEDHIDEVIEYGPDYTEEWWENELDESSGENEIKRWEVLEFWGVVPAEVLEDSPIDIPEAMEDDKEFYVNVFICKDKILRVVINPFKPARIPYLLIPYEENPYSPFGIGLAENMEDCQTLLNGFTRLAIDNAVLSSNIMLEVDEQYLVPGQDFKAYPGKIWRRQSGPPGQAIFATKWPNVTNECMQLYDRFRQAADEVTGIPSFSHGSTGVMGTGRTASGMSMLMGAAAVTIKNVIKNVDDYLIQPLGEALFAWNMQFDFDPEIKGDLDIKAKGTNSLMVKEIKSQKLMQFLQLSANPAVSPLIKLPYLIKELASSLDLDPEEIVNDPDEAKAQALLLSLMNQANGGMPGQEGQMPGGPMENPNNLGTGGVPQPPQPGQQGFTASPQAPQVRGPGTPQQQQVNSIGNSSASSPIGA